MLSVGVDIIEIERVAQMVVRYGERFLARVYTPGEQIYCRNRAAKLASLICICVRGAEYDEAVCPET